MPGKGVQGTIDGQKCFGGNEKIIEMQGLSVSGILRKKSRELAAKGKTPMYFGTDKEILGFVAVSDVVKENSKIAIEKLKALK